MSTTSERWRQVLARQRRSGLSVTAFCHRHGVAASSFFAWQRRLGRGPTAPPGFIALQPAAAPAPPTDGAAPLELHLGAGRWLVVRRGFDGQTLRELLAVLEGRP
jgi:hypothetical protein